MDAVLPYARGEGRNPAPAVIDVDSLDLDSPRMHDAAPSVATGTAYLQYTSGSTRLPAGVVISHKNVVVNVEQALSDYFGGPAPKKRSSSRGCPSITTWA